jgi:CDP-diacylglycerol--glycerol-3-phosphate 3-phosphatidyltransferase
MNRPWTLPNLLCWIRLLVSPLLILLAWTDQANAMLLVFVGLSLTDGLDGKLARRLHQRSEFGARLDSVADATMYVCLAAGLAFLRHEVLLDAAWWIAAALLSYLAAAVAAFVKFGRLASYHTRSAKTAWFLVAVATISLLAGGPHWPLRLAMAGVTLANVESLLLTRRLTEPLTDIKSVLALRGQRADEVLPASDDDR